MKRIHVIIAYFAAVAVFSISIDVAAKLQEIDWETGNTSTSKVEKQVKKKAKGLDLGITSNGEKASEASCDQFLDMQKEIAMELAMAFAPKKEKKKVRKKLNQEFKNQRAEMIEVCQTIPQSEIDCVLSSDDPMEWANCGDGIAKLN